MTYVKFVEADPLVDLLENNLDGGHHTQLDVVDLTQHRTHRYQHAGCCEVRDYHTAHTTEIRIGVILSRSRIARVVNSVESVESNE